MMEGKSGGWVRLAWRSPSPAAAGKGGVYDTHASVAVGDTWRCQDFCRHHARRNLPLGALPKHSPPRPGPAPPNAPTHPPNNNPTYATAPTHPPPHATLPVPHPPTPPLAPEQPFEAESVVARVGGLVAERGRHQEVAQVAQRDVLGVLHGQDQGCTAVDDGTDADGRYCCERRTAVDNGSSIKHLPPAHLHIQPPTHPRLAPSNRPHAPVICTGTHTHTAHLQRLLDALGNLIRSTLAGPDHALAPRQPIVPVDVRIPGGQTKGRVWRVGPGRWVDGRARAGPTRIAGRLLEKGG